MDFLRLPPARAAEDSRVDKLLNLLVEKKIITPDEARGLLAEVSAPAPKAEAKPAPGGAGAINISGYMKLSSVWTENGTTSNNDTFRVRQARIKFSGSPPGRCS